MCVSPFLHALGDGEDVLDDGLSLLVPYGHVQLVLILQGDPLQILDLAELEAVPSLPDGLQFVLLLVLLLLVDDECLLDPDGVDPVHLDELGEGVEGEDEVVLVLEPLVLDSAQHDDDEELDLLLLDLHRFVLLDYLLAGLLHLTVRLLPFLGRQRLCRVIFDLTDFIFNLLNGVVHPLPQIQIHVEVDDLQDLRL